MGRVPSSSLPLAAHRPISVRESSPSFAAAAESLRRFTSSQYTEATPLIEVGLKGSIFSLIDREVCSSQSSEAPAAVECCHAAPSRKRWQLGSRNGGGSSRRNPSDNYQSKLQAVAEEGAIATAAAAAGSREPKWKRFLHKVKGSVQEAAPRLPRSGTALKLGLPGIQAGAIARPHVKPRDSTLIWERRNVARIAPLQLRHHHAARATARPGRLAC